MSTGPVVDSNTSAMPEPTSTIDADVTNTAPDDASKQTNGDGYPVKAGDASHLPGEGKSADANKPAELQSGGTTLAKDVDSHEPAGEAKPNALNPGIKRELESTSAPSNADNTVIKSSDPAVDAPTAKKQKTDDTTATENGTQADGGRKKTGRPKKAKEAVKKAIPTDGIGSRTRSRTKVVT